MEPLALSLQRLGAFDFCGAESLDLLRIDVIWNLDDYFYMEERDISLEKRYGRTVEERATLVAARHRSCEGRQPRAFNFVLRDLGSSAIKGLHKTLTHFVVGRWVLTGDEFAIFDHKRLEDSFGRDGDVAAGDFQSVVDAKRHFAATHQVFLSIVLLVIRKQCHAVTGILRILSKPFCLFRLACYKCGTELLSLRHRRRYGKRSVTEKRRRLCRGMGMTKQLVFK